MAGQLLCGQLLRGDNNCMELLIQAGADVKVVDKNGWTALMFDSWERR